MVSAAELHVRQRQWRGDDVSGFMHLVITYAVQAANMWAYQCWQQLFWPCAAMQALVNLRWFMIFHDCGHGSFCASPWLNTLVHSLTSIMVYVPTGWSTGHAMSVSCLSVLASLPGQKHLPACTKSWFNLRAYTVLNSLKKVHSCCQCWLCHATSPTPTQSALHSRRRWYVPNA